MLLRKVYDPSVTNVSSAHVNWLSWPQTREVTDSVGVPTPLPEVKPGVSFRTNRWCPWRPKTAVYTLYQHHNGIKLLLLHSAWNICTFLGFWIFLSTTLWCRKWVNVICICLEWQKLRFYCTVLLEAETSAKNLIIADCHHTWNEII